jgi:hypothetical protein
MRLRNSTLASSLHIFLTVQAQRNTGDVGKRRRIREGKCSIAVRRFPYQPSLTKSWKSGYECCQNGIRSMAQHGAERAVKMG